MKRQKTSSGTKPIIGQGKKAIDLKARAIISSSYPFSPYEDFDLNPKLFPSEMINQRSETPVALMTI